MSEATPVDVNSKTSLFKRLAVLIKADAAKWAKSLTSVTNALVTAATIWLAVGPYFEHRGAVNSSAQVVNLEGQLLQSQEATRQWKESAGANKLAADAASKENASLRLRLDEAENGKTLPTAEQAKPQQEAALETPIVKAKVRRVPLKKDDPSTWQQFVTWYEANIGKPEGN